MNFHINDFEGPLDLLLHLVKKSKMDIYDIQISKIIEEYLEIIHNLQDQKLDLASSYLVMAAELVHLKSRSLLNIEDEETEEEIFASEEDLKNRLIQYEIYKEITQDLIDLNLKRNEFYTKEPTNISQYNDKKIEKSNDITLEDLLEAFLNLEKRKQDEKPIDTKITRKEMSVNSRINSIRQLLLKKAKLNFSDLFDIFSKEYVVVTFLSILDMSKNKEILLSQENNFGNILIEKRV